MAEYHGLRFLLQTKLAKHRSRIKHESRKYHKSIPNSLSRTGRYKKKKKKLLPYIDHFNKIYSYTTSEFSLCLNTTIFT